LKSIEKVVDNIVLANGRNSSCQVTA